jgi:hypothetical protein
MFYLLLNVKIIHGVPKAPGDLASWKRMGSRDQSHADYCEGHATSLAELVVHQYQKQTEKLIILL